MKKHIVVLTGAGVSAESGFATFRDTGGLWEQYDVNDVASIEGWYRNRQLVLDFYNQRRAQLKEAKPNAAHEAIAGLEKEYLVDVITQNVDNLHERAGSTRVLHLHGELTKVRPENGVSTPIVNGLSFSPLPPMQAILPPRLMTAEVTPSSRRTSQSRSAIYPLATAPRSTAVPAFCREISDPLSTMPL